MGLSSLQVYRTLGPAPIVICPVVSSTILATLTHGILRKVFGYGVALFLETVAQKAQKCGHVGSPHVAGREKLCCLSGCPSDLPAQVCLGTDKVASEELW